MYTDGGDFEIDPTNNAVYWMGGRLYVSPTYYMGVSMSSDYGSTWTRWQLTSVYGYVNALAIDPTNTDIVYSAGYPSIYKTTNAGGSWTELLPGLTSTVYDIVVDPVVNNTLYAARYNGVWKSTDGGYNWLNTNCTSSTAYSVLIDPGDHNTVYAGTRDGCYRSTNGGSSWTLMNEGLEDTYVTSLGIYQDNYLFAATNAGGMYRWSLNVGTKEVLDIVTPVSICASPNPARGQTTISYELRNDTPVDISIYDIQGRLVTTLVNEVKPAGLNRVNWDAHDNERRKVPAGVYFYTLTIPESIYTNKLIIIE